MRLLGMAALGHVEAKSRHDGGSRLFVALEHAPLETEPAKPAVVRALDAELVGESAVAPLCLADLDLEQGRVVLMREPEEAGGRDLPDPRIEPEHLAKSLVEVEHVIQEVPVPDARPAGPRGAAEPVWIGKRGDGSGLRARAIAEMRHLGAGVEVGRLLSP